MDEIAGWDTIKEWPDLPYTIQINITQKEYRCDVGHVYHGETPFMVSVTKMRGEDIELSSGPLCPFCYILWIKRNCGTREVIQ